jgi:hypothetical protein
MGTIFCAACISMILFKDDVRLSMFLVADGLPCCKYTDVFPGNLAPAASAAPDGSLAGQHQNMKITETQQKRMKSVQKMM